MYISNNNDDDHNNNNNNKDKDNKNKDKDNMLIDNSRYIKIQLQTIDLSARLWGINTEFVGFIPQSLVLRSIVLG